MKKVVLTSNDTENRKRLTDSCITLIDALLKSGYRVLADRQSSLKFSLAWKFDCELIPDQPEGCVSLPFVVRISVSDTLNFALVDDEDFEWFTQFLKAGLTPPKVCSLILTSRNQKILALLNGQKEVEEMIKKYIPVHVPVP
ncbi:MAG: hypothetical protein V4686_00445 [Patescibacteria group bacterium]